MKMVTSLGKLRRRQEEEWLEVVKGYGSDKKRNMRVGVQWFQ